MIINNKGISPIIATVVLLTLVVVLAGIIYKSGNEFIAQLSPPAECGNVYFDAGLFKETDGKIVLELENRGTTVIESIELEIISESTGQSDKQIIPISASPAQSVRYTIDFGISDGSTAKIIPQIKNAEGVVSPCPDELGQVVDLVIVSK
ncbi:MAG: archaellin/type IV pilin N-terminal domain-containing protein [Candidatus Pacearchaeota archaeon]